MNNFNLFFSEKIAESVVNDTISEEIKEVIKSIYRKVFRRDMNSSCKNCFTDSFFELYNLWKSDLSKFTALFNCEFTLNFGEVLSEFGSSDNIATRVNMTNDLALNYLSINRNNSRLFEVLPEDWKQQVEDYETSKIVVPIIPVTPEVTEEVEVKVDADIELPKVDQEKIPVTDITEDEIPLIPTIFDNVTTESVPDVPKGKKVVTPIIEPIIPEVTPEIPTDSNNEIVSESK